MTALSALVRAYEQLADLGRMPAFGYANTGIHYCIELDREGQFLGPPQPLNPDKQGVAAPVTMSVPSFGGRTGSRAPPYFLWDNSAYVLGLSAKPGYDAEIRFKRFRDYHQQALAQTQDEGLRAVLSFLVRWKPEDASSLGMPEDVLDRNLVFRLAGEPDFIHERIAAMRAWEDVYVPDTLGRGICLVTGQNAPIARLHSPLRGFDEPTRIVTFDRHSDAFTSYGHFAGGNAPTGIFAAFAYTSALNHLLLWENDHRQEIGDVTIVFWRDPIADGEAGRLFRGLLIGLRESGNPAEDCDHRRRLERFFEGEAAEEIVPALAAGQRFHVLGMVPNVGRMSVRLYTDLDCSEMMRNLQSLRMQLKFEPLPSNALTPISTYLGELAPADRQAGPPRDLTVDTLYAMLMGQRFPTTLLMHVLLRIRGDGIINARRAGLLRAILTRNFERVVPIAFDPDNLNRGYQLGRLFAAYGLARRASFGFRVTFPSKDKAYASASANPRRMFSMLKGRSSRHVLVNSPEFRRHPRVTFSAVSRTRQATASRS